MCHVADNYQYSSTVIMECSHGLDGAGRLVYNNVSYVCTCVCVCVHMCVSLCVCMQKLGYIVAIIATKNKH